MLESIKIVMTDNEGNTETQEITDELTIRKLSAIYEQGLDVQQTISDGINELTIGEEGCIEVDHEIQDVKSEISKLKSVDQEGRAVLEEKLKELEEKRDSLIIK